VIYLLGDDDSDPAQADLDTSCAGESEGAERLSRGKAYFRYLHDRHPQDFRGRLWLVPAAAHVGSSMIDSACGIAALFDRGVCAKAGGGGWARGANQRVSLRDRSATGGLQIPLRGGRIRSERRAGADRPAQQLAAAVRALIAEPLFRAARAERALETADPRLERFVRQVSITALAVRTY